MSTLSKNAIAAFHRRLGRWYQQHGRKVLPWRTTSDPYAIYISEIMLQQTQVKTVLARFYFPFLKRFPSLQHLAKARQNAVLAAWEGLGYYNRALNLQKAAKLCQGKLPETVDELMALPGIGRNTAHAIAAFAYRKPVAVMEANVRRVLSRIFALTHPTEEELWDKAHILLDKAAPFDYNQAMMDLGALMCSKREPDCPRCPAQIICLGKASPEAYPASARKKSPPVRKKRIVLLRNRLGYYYASSRKSRFLNGLYHFIETDSGAKDFAFHGRRYSFVRAKRLGHIRQQYSHFTLEAEIYLMQVSGIGSGWHSRAALTKLPFSNAERKMLELLS